MTPKTRRRVRITLIVLAVLVVLWVDCIFTGIVLGLFNHPRDRWGWIEMAVLESADSVEVIRLSQPPGLPRSQADMPFYGMVATGSPIKPPDAWVTRMRDAVNNSWNYDWVWHARCLPEPGVCVRFRRFSETVDLLFCFECSLVSLAHPNKHGGPIQDQWIDFRVKRAPFAGLVKELFPNDAAIQAIGK